MEYPGGAYEIPRAAHRATIIASLAYVEATWRIARSQHTQHVFNCQPMPANNRLTTKDLRIDREALQVSRNTCNYGRVFFRRGEDRNERMPAAQRCAISMSTSRSRTYWYKESD